MPALIRAATVPDEGISQLCDRAAVSAARESGVPLDVLRAISRTETGRAAGTGLHPWPWTVNMEGAGKWFDTEDAARAFVFSHFKRGARSFDVGCFQINYKWHGAAFRSIEDMFDPVLNAEYAARFLHTLYGELGDWTAAAGAYHSRTPDHARAYSVRFEKIRARLRPVAEFASALDVQPALATLPRALGLSEPVARPLLAGGEAVLGSLVPIGTRRDMPVFVALE